jgi:hypothetical protein
MKFAAIAGTSVVVSPTVVADAGSRISFWVNFNTRVVLTQFFGLLQSVNSPIGWLRLDASNILNWLDSDATAPNKSGTTVLSDNTWYHITFTYVITAVANYTIKVYLNGVLELTVTQADFNIDKAGSAVVSFGVISAITATINIDDVYIDNSSALTDPGAIQITAKLPNALNVNNFNTAIGSSTNRWESVNQRALSEAKGWGETTTTATRENYGIESAATGDVNLTGATQIAYVGWVWAKKGAGGSGSPAITLNGVDTTIALATTSAGYFSAFVDSGTYPTNAAGIGMLASGAGADTFFYEGGVLVAYIPASNVLFAQACL